MKKLIALLLPVFITTSSSGQQMDSTVFNRQFYLQKSKTQKATAWVLLGGGAALIATGLLIGDREESTFDDAATGGVIAIAGTVASIISIPVFIASSRNKRKAMEFTANLQWKRTPLKGANGVAGHTPYLSLTFNF